MIELFFVACLSTAPDQCRDHSLIYTDDVSLMTCMLHAQTQLAKWAETRPQQVVQTWKCRSLSQREARA